MTVCTPPSAAMASSNGPSSRGISTSTADPALTSRTTYALFSYGPIGPILTMRISPSSKVVISAPATRHRLGRTLLRCGRWLGVAIRRRLSSQLCLEGALLRLVVLALRHGPHVGQRRPIGSDLLPSREAHTEVLRYHADHDPRFGGAESGQRREPPQQILGVLGSSPDPGRIPAIVRGDDLAERVHASRHADRKAMQRRRGLECLLDPGGVHARDLGRVDGAQSLPHAQWTLERPLDRHLLIEAEPDQERCGI